jgi:thiol:disulfide interchange protein DsbD
MLSSSAALPVSAANGQPSKDDLNWEPFTAEKLASYRASGKPVLIDFTAAWCLTCQVNDRVVFRSEDVKKKLKQSGIALLRADWTSNDPAITEALAQYGRSAVPLYVLYGQGQSQPVILPDGLLRPSTFLNALQQVKL